MAKPDRPPGSLPGERESLDQERVEVLLPGPLAQLVRARAKPRLVEGRQLRLELGDGTSDRQVLLDLALVGVEQP